MKPADERNKLFANLYALKNDYSEVRSTDKGYAGFLDICVRPIVGSKLFNTIMNGEDSIVDKITADCESLGIILLLNSHLKWEEEATYRKENSLSVDDKVPVHVRVAFRNNEYTESDQSNSNRKSGWSPSGLERFMAIKQDIILFRSSSKLKQKGNEVCAKDLLHTNGTRKRKPSGAGVTTVSEVKRLRALETAYNNPMMSAFASI
jgi:hypothetical protein